MAWADSRTVVPRFRPPVDARLLLASVRRDGPVIAFMLGCGLFGQMLAGRRSEESFVESFEGSLRWLLLVACVCALVHWMLRCVFVLRAAHPLRQLGRDALGLASGRLFEQWLPLLLASTAMIVGFSQMKGSIPLLAGGFGWDATFSELDRLAHFGRHPFEWLLPVFGHPAILFVLNLNYNIWFLATWSCFFAFAGRPAGAVGRSQFLMGYVLLWFLGGFVVATLFSSAGPCFYGLVVSGDDPYAPLMRHLASARETYPIWALDVQDMLWRDFSSGTGEFGISAMPSLHNATAAFMMLASRHLDSRLRILLGLHAALIYLGSILLAWHYAIDAYLGWALAAAAWYGSAPVARWWDARIARGTSART